MAILNKVLENKRDQYMIQVLEESTSELESLKTKQYLNENLALIGKILVEEGVVDAARANLANNWGKYAAGAGVAAAGVGAGEAIAHPEATEAMLQHAQDGIKNGAEAAENFANKVGQKIIPGQYTDSDGKMWPTMGQTDQSNEAITAAANAQHYETPEVTASRNAIADEAKKYLNANDITTNIGDVNKVIPHPTV